MLLLIASGIAAIVIIITALGNLRSDAFTITHAHILCMTLDNLVLTLYIRKYECCVPVTRAFVLNNSVSQHTSTEPVTL